MDTGYLLAGLSGGLQGILQGIQYNQSKSDEENKNKVALEIKALNLLAENGDDEIRKLAVAGLMEASSDPKYKGGALAKLFGSRNLADNPYLKQIDAILAQHGADSPGMQKASKVLAGGDTATGADSPGMVKVKANQVLAGPAAGGATEDSAWAPGDVGKEAGDLLPTRPTPTPTMSAGMAPTAGVPTNGQPSGIRPQVLARGAAPGPAARPPVPDIVSTTMSAMGPPPNPVPPSREEVGRDMAKQYGSTPEQMNAPEYTHPGHLVDRGNEQNLRDWRTGTETNYRAGVTDTRTRVDQYRDSIVSLVKTGAVAQAQEMGMTERAKIAEEGATRRQGMQLQAQTAAEKKAAKAFHDKELADIEKLAIKKDPNKPGGGLLYDGDTIAQLRASADARYTEATGEQPKGAAGRAAQVGAVTAGVEAATAGAVGRRKAAVAAGPPAAGPAAAGGPPPAPVTPTRVPAAAAGGPPGAPITAAETARMESLKTKVQTRGRESLTSEEFTFLTDYYNRLKASTSTFH